MNWWTYLSGALEANKRQYSINVLDIAKFAFPFCLELPLFSKDHCNKRFHNSSNSLLYISLLKYFNNFSFWFGDNSTFNWSGIKLTDIKLCNFFNPSSPR